MHISLHNIGKKYGREWIFRQISCEIRTGEKLVILGGNGSGKSTLLQLISAYVTPNEGKLSYYKKEGESPIETEHIRHHLAFASPYLQLIEEFTAPELIVHLAKGKPYLSHLKSSDVLEISQLKHASHKYIKQYSSGMKQRLKLALAILAETPVLLLDEPLSNLDKAGTEWYKKMINDYTSNRTVIVCSNAIADEHFFCERHLNVMDHKN